MHPRLSGQIDFISGSSPITKQTEYDFVNHLDDTISSQILLMIIKWIHNLPTFLNLPIHDQVFIYFSLSKKQQVQTLSNNL
jgi:hypothetical protein